MFSWILYDYSAYSLLFWLCSRKVVFYGLFLCLVHLCFTPTTVQVAEQTRMLFLHERSLLWIFPCTGDFVKSITSHKQLLMLFDLRCFIRMKLLWWRHPWFDDLDWIFCFDALYCNRMYVITLILLHYFVWQVTPMHFMTGKILRRPLNCGQFGNTLRSFISFSLCCLDVVNHHIN